MKLSSICALSPYRYVVVSLVGRHEPFPAEETWHVALDTGTWQVLCVFRDRETAFNYVTSLNDADSFKEEAVNLAQPGLR